MDILQEYAVHGMHAYNSAVPYLRPVQQFIYDLQSKSYPIILPYLNAAAVWAQESPAIISVGVLILFLLIAMQILNFIRRIMMFWMRLVMRLMFWATVVVVLSAVWQRGVGRTAEDAVAWGRELSDVWWREYRRWEGYQNRSQGQAQGYGRTNARASWK